MRKAWRLKQCQKAWKSEPFISTVAFINCRVYWGWSWQVTVYGIGWREKWGVFFFADVYGESLSEGQLRVQFQSSRGFSFISKSIDPLEQSPDLSQRCCTFHSYLSIYYIILPSQVSLWSLWFQIHENEKFFNYLGICVHIWNIFPSNYFFKNYKNYNNSFKNVFLLYRNVGNIKISD